MLQVSDSHLSAAAPLADANWQAMVDYAAQTRPDLVVHTGDISLDGASDPADLEYARRKFDEFDRLGIDWLAIPGNHDIGDFGQTRYPTSPELGDRYESVFGEPFWSRTVAGWLLVGLDIQSLAAGTTPSGDEQWAWLADELRGHRPTAVFLHRPLRPLEATDHDEPRRFVTEPIRSRLDKLFDEAGVSLVASGHVHQWRSVTSGGRSNVWAPATWAVLPDRVQPVLGTKVVGVVEHQLGETAVSTLGETAGMRTLAVGDDFGSPYDRSHTD